VILREVFRYELGYRLRSPSTWAYALFLFAIGFLIVGVGEGATVRVNAPVEVAEQAALFCGLFGMLVTAGIFGDAAIRDVEVGMEPLLYTTRLGKAEYLGGRLLGALAINAILLVAVLIGLAVASVMPWVDAADFGPFRLAAYVQPYLLFLLPNVVLVGTILFTIGALTRQTVPVYLGAAAFFIGYLTAANYWSAIGTPAVALLADALGINALQELTRHWTPVERNTRLVGFPAMLLWNRLLWLAVAAGVFALLQRSFAFAHADGGGRRRGRREMVDTAPERAVPVAVPRIAGTFGLRSRVRQVLAVARRSLEESLASRGIVAAIVGGVGAVLLWGWNVGSTVFDTSTWPVTFLVTEEVFGRRLFPFVWILIAVFAGELVWKEREVGTAEIADAVPLPDGTALLGRFLALVALIALFSLSFVVGGVLLQTLQGYRHYELGLYLRVAFGINLAHFAILAALAMTLHVLVHHKYFGHIVVLVSFVFTQVAPNFGLRHHLLVYSTDPGWTYSDMNGFGPFVAPIVWFTLYWASWALLLGVAASLFWLRGREPGARSRISQARARFAGPLARAASVAAVLIIAFGGFIFYNTNVLNEYRTPDEAGGPQAEYERRYERFAGAPQPTIVAAALRIEIHPETPSVDLHGSYRLVNRTGRAIDSVHVVLHRQVRARSISVDRPATTVLEDAELGYRVLALERPLGPGDSLALAFDVAYEAHGFPNDGIETSVTRHGASFNRLWMPFIGYQPYFELSGADARRRFGLAPQPPMPAPNDSQATRSRWPWRDADLVQVDAIVGTSADQIAIMPGVLRKSWTENGRRYFRYETEKPSAFGATVHSGRYAVLEDRWNDIGLRIYHHPAHTYVLDRMVRGMKASLEYYTKEFGPYPYRELRIVEYPRYGGFGIAHPYIVSFAEDVFLSHVKDGELDQTFFGTAHEVGHTWWGGMVGGAMVRGQELLVESLANYSAMMVTEKTYGPEAARRIYGFQMQRYLDGRAQQSHEVPLLEVEHQPYIAYRKGAVAMYALRLALGEERVNAALLRYAEKHPDTGAPPYPTSLDLYAELRAVTPDSVRPLLADLFETVTLWEVKTERAVAERTERGEYEVALDVVARKVRADSLGKETETPMDDLVELGVFAAGAGDDLGAPLYLKQHRIRSGTQRIRVTVPKEPSRAGIDPYRMLIDRQGGDNVVEVKPAR
jgi:ABC-2 type transport system permease protein